MQASPGLICDPNLAAGGALLAYTGSPQTYAHFHCVSHMHIDCLRDRAQQGRNWPAWLLSTGGCFIACAEPLISSVLPQAELSEDGGHSDDESDDDDDAAEREQLLVMVHCLIQSLQGMMIEDMRCFSGASMTHACLPA